MARNLKELGKGVGGKKKGGKRKRGGKTNVKTGEAVGKTREKKSLKEIERKRETNKGSQKEAQTILHNQPRWVLWTKEKTKEKRRAGKYLGRTKKTHPKKSKKKKGKIEKGKKKSKQEENRRSKKT